MIQTEGSLQDLSPLDQNHPRLQDTGLRKTRFPNKDYVVISENWGPGGKEGPKDLALKSGKASWSEVTLQGNEDFPGREGGRRALPQGAL